MFLHAAPVPVPSRTVLLVDDEELIRAALQRTLRRDGYQVLTAAGPEEALELLRTTPVDVVMSDHLMPGMTGIELLGLVRDRHPSCIRILLTGHADLETAIAAVNQDAIFRLLTKPWNDTELKVVLFAAFEELEQQQEHRRLLAVVRRQEELLRRVERTWPGITQLALDGNWGAGDGAQAALGGK